MRSTGASTKGKLPFQIPNRIGANYKVKANETHSLLLRPLIVPAVSKDVSCTLRLPAGSVGTAMNLKCFAENYPHLSKQRKKYTEIFCVFPSTALDLDAVTP